jgi:predicted CoA-binding protein
MPLLDSNAAITNLLRSAKTIAVVGLSDNPGRDSYHIGIYLLSAGYRIFPVNPQIQGALGLQSYPDIASIGEHIDIVDIFRRPEAVPGIITESVAARAGAVWLQFGTVNERAITTALAAGLDVVADRCIMVEHRRLAV